MTRMKFQLELPNSEDIMMSSELWYYNIDFRIMNYDNDDDNDDSDDDFWIVSVIYKM